MKLFLYARKSSESEDRQVQSIEDQKYRLRELALRSGTIIHRDIYQESKSAKEPNARPKFNEMLDRIEAGEADGILCWQINRLSRNPIDSARIQWMLQKGIIKSIQTIDREYLPEDNTLMFSMETGIANQYILDLSKNVKRGMDSKIKKGIMPCLASCGYVNDQINKTIIKDTDRFDLVRKMWDLMLTGNYKATEILDMANDQWGFRTIKRKRIGGKPLSRSGIYKIFTNPFYAGIIEWKGEQYEGDHEPMITLDEYDRVQQLLGRNGKPRPKKHEFAYTGIIHCGECGSAITAEHKTKYIKSTGETKNYTYYRCTKRKKGNNCQQKGSIQETELEKQISEEISKYTIIPEFRDWALDVLKMKNSKETNDRQKIYKSVNTSLQDTQKQLDRLTDLLIRDLISEDEFKTKKNELQKELTSLKDQRNNTEDRAQTWLELTEKTFNFVTYAQYHFENGDMKTKREIFSALGSNFSLKDRILSLEANEWLEPIKNNYPKLKEEYKRLEPTKTGIDKPLSKPLNSIITRWWGNRTSVELFITTISSFLVHNQHDRFSVFDRKIENQNKPELVKS